MNEPWTSTAWVELPLRQRHTSSLNSRECLHNNCEHYREKNRKQKTLTLI